MYSLGQVLKHAIKMIQGATISERGQCCAEGQQSHMCMWRSPVAAGRRIAAAAPPLPLPHAAPGGQRHPNKHKAKHPGLGLCSTRGQKTRGPVQRVSAGSKHRRRLGSKQLQALGSGRSRAHGPGMPRQQQQGAHRSGPAPTGCRWGASCWRHLPPPPPPPGRQHPSAHLLPW